MSYKRFGLLFIFAFFILQVQLKASAFCNSPGKVLAFYYGWYAPQPFDGGSWNKYASRLGDQPQAGLYDSADDNVIENHIDQAMANGIDGFVISWMGIHNDVGANKPNAVLGKMLAYARQKGNFCISVDFEPLHMRDQFGMQLGQVSQQMSSLLANYGSHTNYLQVNGRPAVFFWKNEAFNESYWQSIKSQQTSPFYWIAEAGGSNQGVTWAGKRLFDNCHFYSSWWAGALGKQQQMWQTLTGRAKFATVAPGFHNGSERFGRWAGQGESTYKSQWQFAINNKPDYVLITSWNEWAEGSYIEPSSAFGDRYLKLTASFAKSFKSAF